MKNSRIKRTFVLLTMVSLFVLNSFNASQITYNADFVDTSDLDQMQQMDIHSMSYCLQTGEYEEAYKFFSYHNGLPQKTVEQIFTRCTEVCPEFAKNYVERARADGYVSADYQLPTSSNSNSGVTIAVSTPTPVTTEKCDEKTMWATQQVNIRENGSTDYPRVGKLNPNEAVTVTGIDSTGWYEIRTADGTIGHVSNKYLTEGDPSVSNAVDNTKNDSTEDSVSEDAVPSAIPTQESYIISIEERTVTWFNAETGEEEIVEFDENIPLDQIEDCANRFLLNHEDYIASPTPESTVEPSAAPEPTIVPSKKPQPTVEPTVTPTPEVSLVHQITNSVWFIVFGFGLGIVCIVLGFVWWKKK